MNDKTMRGIIGRTLALAAVLIVVAGVALLAFGSYRVLNGPPLHAWHRFVPSELRADQLDAADWTRYLAQEDAVMASVRSEVSQKLAPDDRVPINRYFEGSPVYPAHFAHDWNRSYVMEPDGKPVGVVVLLHGLTDSPYSLRHIAERYREHGFVGDVVSDEDRPTALERLVPHQLPYAGRLGETGMLDLADELAGQYLDRCIG